MSYLDRGHDGARDNRARDREGNLIPTVAEQREEFARRAAREQEEIAAAQLREARVDALLAQGGEMLDRIIADARSRRQIINELGQHIEDWEEAAEVEKYMWIELWFLPGSVNWDWNELSREEEFSRVQNCIPVPFHVSLCNDGSAGRKLARVILQSQDSAP